MSQRGLPQPAPESKTEGFRALLTMMTLVAVTLLLAALVSRCGSDEEPAASASEEAASPRDEREPEESEPPRTASSVASDPESDAPADQPPSPQPSSAPPSAATPEVDENDPAVQCARRLGNPGEVIAWNSYGSDGPNDAYTLGEGYRWLFDSELCVTVEEATLRVVPDLPGYCTIVGKVESNPGYPVDQIPAPRLPNATGMAGDC